MIGFWNDEEDAALQGLSAEAQVVYLRGIRRFADKNGISGLARRINWASLCECCHFVPDIGSKKKSVMPTRDTIKHRLGELERAGLIVRRENLVFELPLAIQNESVQMRTARGRHEDGTSRTAHEKACNANGFAGIDGTMTAHTDIAEDGHTSPITNHHNIYTSNARAKTADVVPLKRGIPSDFKVSPAVMSWCVHRGIADPAPYLDHFINTCQANGYQYADHDAAFKKAIADDWAGVRRQGRPGNFTGAHSRVPDNSDTSWLTDDLLEPAK